MKFSLFNVKLYNNKFLSTHFQNNFFNNYHYFQVGKNLYQWHGTTHWLTTLAGLRQLALRFNMLERYNEVKTLEENDPAGCGNYSVSPPIGGGTPKGISPFTPTYSPCSSSSGPSPSPAERKTSLGFACQKFLMLFLIAPEVKDFTNNTIFFIGYMFIFSQV